MYCDYFGLNQKPFEVSPDPEFIYFTRENREVLASLIYGVTGTGVAVTMLAAAGSAI